MTVQKNVTRERISQVEETMSERDLAITDAVALLGLMNGEQLRQLYFSDHTSLSSSRRSSQQTLRRLTEAEVLARLSRRVGGVRSGSAGYIYALGRVGQRLAQRWRDDPRRRTRRAHEPGKPFVNHRVACAQLFVDLHLAQSAGELLLELYLGEPECWRQRIGPFGKPLTLKPDGFARLKVGERILHWFIEVDLATESQTVIARKGRAYLDHYAAGAEVDVMPRVIWLTPDSARADRLKSTLHALGGPARALHVVSTFERATQTMKGDF